MPPGHADPKERILILDFGSQYTQLIARRVREQNVYCEIQPFDVGLDAIRRFDPAGIVLSGGPSSVSEKGAPTVDPELFETGIPILGICYGLQLLVHLLGGRVEAAEDREYGRAVLEQKRADSLVGDVETAPRRTVWMSHGDRVLSLPEGFCVLAESPNSPFAAVRDESRPIWGLQFHPEVAHTEGGDELLARFVGEICGCSGNWTMEKAPVYHIVD